MGAVPVQEANRLRSAKRATSPTSDGDPGGAGGADPEDLQQCAAGRGDVLAEPAVELLEFAVEGFDLADQLSGQHPAGPPGGVVGAHRGE